MGLLSSMSETFFGFWTKDSFFFFRPVCSAGNASILFEPHQLLWTKPLNMWSRSKTSVTARPFEIDRLIVHKLIYIKMQINFCVATTLTIVFATEFFSEDVCFYRKRRFVFLINSSCHFLTKCVQFELRLRSD